MQLKSLDMDGDSFRNRFGSSAPDSSGLSRKSADIEESKSGIALNAPPPQASYPW